MTAIFGPTRDCELFRARTFVEELTVPPGHTVRVFTLYDADWDQAILVYDEETMEEVWRSGSGEMGGEVEEDLPLSDSDEERVLLLTGWHRQPGGHWDQSRRRTHFSLPGCRFLVLGFEEGRDQDYRDAILVCHVTDE